MTQASRSGSTPFGLIALIAAGIIALVAIGTALWKSSGDATANASAPAAAPVADVDTMIQRLRDKLAADPNNAEGWKMLGWSLRETGRFPEAIEAWRKATALAPGNAEYWAGLGEAIVLAGGKTGQKDAEAAFRKAIAIDPANPQARYYLAVLRDLGGDHQGAIDDLLTLLKSAPPGAPWAEQVREAILNIGRTHTIDVASKLPAPIAGAGEVATAAIPGPTREEMQAATALPPGQQDAMVRGMVESLAAKLKADPANADGWIRLMRARMVLNEPAAASQALKDAKAAFKGNASEQARLTEAAKTLGVP